MADGTTFQIGWVETYTGQKFYPLDPDPETVYIMDIAHALSQLCRFTGHCQHFYSVGQHSVNCAKEMRILGESPRIQLYALLHDASEAYLQDIARPIKSSIGNYEEIEAKLMDVIWDAFGIPKPSKEEWAKVRYVDDLMLLNEAKLLMPLKHWELGEFPTIQNAKFRISEMSMRSVESEFLELFADIVRNDVIDNPRTV